MKDCLNGQERNLETGKCRKICTEDQQRNLETGRCRRKSPSKSKSPSKNDCIKSTQKKYLNRPGPPYPAQNCKDLIKMGNNEKIYQSKENINNIYKLKQILTSKSPSKSKSQ